MAPVISRTMHSFASSGHVLLVLSVLDSCVIMYCQHQMMLLHQGATSGSKTTVTTNDRHIIITAQGVQEDPAKVSIRCYIRVASTGHGCLHALIHLDDSKSTSSLPHPPLCMAAVQCCALTSVSLQDSIIVYAQHACCEPHNLTQGWYRCTHPHSPAMEDLRSRH